MARDIYDIAIIGSGVVTAELATAWSAAGASVICLTSRLDLLGSLGNAAWLALLQAGEGALSEPLRGVIDGCFRDSPYGEYLDTLQARDRVKEHIQALPGVAAAQARVVGLSTVPGGIKLDDHFGAAYVAKRVSIVSGLPGGAFDIEHNALPESSGLRRETYFEPPAFGILADAGLAEAGKLSGWSGRQLSLLRVEGGSGRYLLLGNEHTLLGLESSPGEEAVVADGLYLRSAPDPVPYTVFDDFDSAISCYPSTPADIIVSIEEIRSGGIDFT